MENRILVTGGTGLIGKYLQNEMPSAFYIGSSDYNLTKNDEVIKMFKDKAGFRCVNRKVDEDQNYRNDDSSNSESEEGPGPHVVYIVYGDRWKW